MTVSSLPSVLIISLNTLALTSALQSRHLALVVIFIMQGIIEVPYRIFRLHFDTITFDTFIRLLISLLTAD